MTPPPPAACHAPRVEPLDKNVVAAARSVILVGNPNVGKSVLFGALTGTYVTVSNYPGTTVEVTRGSATIAGEPWHVMDTPGTNNLTPMSEDEQATRDILLKERGYACVQVCDAKNLRRGLLLATQLAEANDVPSSELDGKLRDPLGLALSFGSGLMILAILGLMIWKPGA
jgi:ferrous iron transport protein B